MKTKKSPQLSNRKGFTLVELLTVIAIVVILAGLSVTAMGWAQSKATKEKAVTQLRLLENGVQQYFADVGEYPKAGGRGDDNKGGDDSLYIYAMCFGDVGDDGKVKTAGRSGVSVEFKSNPNATIYLSELDPNIEGNPWFDKTSPQPGGLVDPYGRYWYYRSGNSSNMNPDFDIWSGGAKVSGSNHEADDITNW